MISVYIAVFLAGVLISSVSQIILKKSAVAEHESFMKEYLNSRVIGAYSIFIVATFCTIYAYKAVPLSMGPVLESSQYIFVAVLSYIFLKEKISRRKLTGLIIIIAGIIVFSI